MKIIQIIQRKQLRGAEVFACQLANHLTQSGHQVMVISLFENESTPLPFNGEIVCIKATQNLRYFDIKGWKKLAQLIVNFDADIVQANAGDTLKYAVFSKLLFGWKASLVFRNASTISQYLRSSFLRYLNGFLLNRVDRIISVSNHSRVDLLHLFPKLESKCLVIPVGIELSEGNQSSEVDVLPKVNYLLHVGGFTFEKNHAGLLRIYKTILENKHNLELWLAGDGPLRNDITNLAIEMGLSEKIRFLGFRSDVPMLMKGAKILVLPSILEGLPGVILEAQFLKVPVVAFDVGGISEVIENNKTGWLIKSGDEVSFANAVNDALGSASIETIKDNAYQQVVTKYDNIKIARQFEQAYLAS